MREILFRGKTKAIAGSPYNNGKPDGEWVKGYLYNDVGCWKIRQFETNYADYIPYEVDPETVGQYTGLTDKNGTKIFEGDVVNVNTNKDTLCHRYEGRNLVIEFDEYHRFIANGRLAYPLRNHYEWEVIGNIHNNEALQGDFHE